MGSVPSISDKPFQKEFVECSLYNPSVSQASFGHALDKIRP